MMLTLASFNGLLKLSFNTVLGIEKKNQKNCLLWACFQFSSKPINFWICSRIQGVGGGGGGGGVFPGGGGGGGFFFFFFFLKI